MSIIYFLIFKVFFPTFGTFSIGRLVDLFQMDLVIILLVIIAIYTVKRWNKIWK